MRKVLIKTYSGEACSGEFTNDFISFRSCEATDSALLRPSFFNKIKLLNVDKLFANITRAENLDLLKTMLSQVNSLDGAQILHILLSLINKEDSCDSSKM
ncbi:hypothetical protein QKQ25_gp132 [Hyphantria cunea granulovirus]|uniref:Uncharacterized protein n=1 Tax=Hyphantria cunea granulovirus TaxID=307448 RepID=A0AAF1D2C2_9BBAC|nr:hypothetical protein QKQ25_gp132 [Hyphantria cunea granulovirus]QBQ01685.1 hypothetical protein HycuGV_00132 [Hyphantria cunea granulovirus]